MLFKKHVVCTAFLLCLLAFSFIGCGKKTESITVAGSTAFQPFAEKIAEQFMKKTPGISINVQGGGSSMGIQSTISGTSNIGMVDLVVLPVEAASLKNYIVAKDGISLIVNPSNPVENLTKEQVQKIFIGTITNWQELGGENKSITVISREEGSGTRSSFEKLLMQNMTLSSRAIIQDSNGTVRESVASDPQAIGYVSTGMVNEKTKALKLDGITPNHASIKDGTYILVRPIYLLTKGEPAGLSHDFIEYVLSGEGQKIIQTSGLIPIK
ncbi:phosphate ABC transporter substrate-binding protein [Candidatus Poribacteria bacterium]|nr:phosphate ABC transporter substrate-binding protein [Candidatus Poribacteria bacterium]